MKRFEVRKLLIVPSRKMFSSQEASFQGSSLLGLDTMETNTGKGVSYWLLIYKGQGTSSSLFGDGTSNLVGVCGWQEAGELGSSCD